MSFCWEVIGTERSDQQLDTLGHDIPECVEGAVRNGKSVVRVGFE